MPFRKGLIDAQATEIIKGWIQWDKERKPIKDIIYSIYKGNSKISLSPAQAEKNRIDLFGKQIPETY